MPSGAMLAAPGRSETKARECEQGGRCAAALRGTSMGCAEHVRETLTAYVDADSAESAVHTCALSAIHGNNSRARRVHAQCNV
jgi:hypothetical protein